MLINILTLLSDTRGAQAFLASSPQEDECSGVFLKVRDDGLSHRSEVGAQREKNPKKHDVLVSVVGSGD